MGTRSRGRFTGPVRGPHSPPRARWRLCPPGGRRWAACTQAASETWPRSRDTAELERTVGEEARGRRGGRAGKEKDEKKKTKKKDPRQDAAKPAGPSRATGAGHGWQVPARASSLRLLSPPSLSLGEVGQKKSPTPGPTEPAGPSRATGAEHGRQVPARVSPLASLPSLTGLWTARAAAAGGPTPAAPRGTPDER